MRSRSLGIALLVAASAGAAGDTAAERIVRRETVAVSGAPAPGVGLAFRGFTEPRIDAGGGVAFHAYCADDPPPFVHGLWRAPDGGAPALVATFEEPPDVVSPLAELWSLAATARGVAFDGPLAQGAGRALWDADESGVAALVAREGELAPVPERRFYSLGGIVAGDGGSAFAAMLSDAQTGVPVGDGLFRRDAAGAVEAIAVTGEDAVEPGTTWSLLGNPLVDPAGRVAFFAQVQDGAAFRFQLLAPDGAGGLEVRLAEGDPAPGTGLPFNGIDPDTRGQGLNAAGEVAFAALRAVGIGDGERSGVWGPDGSGGLRLLALGGEPAPGLPGETHLDFDGLALASDGWTAFAGTTDAGGVGPPSGVWAADRSGPTLPVATRGADAGVGGAVVERIDAFAIAGGGRVFVQGGARLLADDRVLDTLWMRELPDGPLEALLVEGDAVVIDGAVQALRGLGTFNRAVTIAGTSSGGQDGKGAAANDAGQLAVVLRYGNEERFGSGVFRITVPEPAAAGGAAALATLAALAAGRPARR